MAGIARNLVTRPRFDSTDPGEWVTADFRPEEPAGVAERAGAGLDLEADALRASGSNSGLRHPLPETWEPGARYRIDAVVYVRADSRTAVYIAPPMRIGGKWDRPYPKTSQGDPGWAVLSEVSEGTAGWLRVSGTVELQSADRYYDDEGSGTSPYLGDPLSVGVVDWNGTRNETVAVSHIAVVRESDGDPGGYWDGDGRAPTDPDPPADDGVHYVWGGEPFDSLSIAAITGGDGGDPDPDPDPLIIVDPEGLLTGQAGDPILPYPLEANLPGVTWSATGLPDGLTIGASSGEITGTPTAGGTGTIVVRAELDTRVDTLAVTYDIAPEPVDPDPDPEPGAGWDELDTLADELAPRIAAWLDAPGDEDVIAHAVSVVPVVATYVYGYTRGAGWSGKNGEMGTPVMPLQVVIVSAAGRVVSNPEQVSYYSAGDYSERPAVLAGWTLAELGVLRRYRKVRG